MTPEERRKDRKRRRVVLVALLAFFLGVPLFTLLYVFNDLHQTMARNSSRWVTEVAVPAMKNMETDEMLELSTVPFADSWRSKGAEATFGGMGRLVEAGPITVVRTTAQEQDDRGSQRATVQFDGKFQQGEGTVKLKVFKYSVEIVDEKMVGGTWMFDGVEVVRK